MKTCPYCGKDYPDDVSNCQIDDETLVAKGQPPSDGQGHANLTLPAETWVNVNGRIWNHSEPQGVIQTVMGNAYVINQGMARLVLCHGNIELHAMGGPYYIGYADIKKIEKKWWWWNMDWDSSKTQGRVSLCNYNFRPYADIIRDKIAGAAANEQEH